MLRVIVARTLPQTLIWIKVRTRKLRHCHGQEEFAMALSTLDHCSIRTIKLEETRAFYEDLLGLHVGPRPDFDFPGHWLYLGDRPVVHLVGIDPDDPLGLEAYLGGSIDPADLETGSGAFDHLAFRAQDAASLRSKLDAAGLDYREREVPNMKLFQIFLEDPNGITVELNYFEDEQQAA